MLTFTLDTEMSPDSVNILILCTVDGEVKILR